LEAAGGTTTTAVAASAVAASAAAAAAEIHRSIGLLNDQFDLIDLLID
jgi:hypothetical protein